MALFVPVSVIWLLGSVNIANGFVSHSHIASTRSASTKNPFGINHHEQITRINQQNKDPIRTQTTIVSESEITSTTGGETKKDNDIQAVRAPLKFIGPYPCLSLRFPNRATSSQRKRNVKGVSLDFVLDTAANTNTINGQVARELELSMIGKALPGVGAGGAIEGGQTFLLGDCVLDRLPVEEEQFTFMTDLTASALPVASPAAAGLLSLPFFQCFEGGVEFQWGAISNNDNNNPEDMLPPSITFYGTGESDRLLKNMTRVPIKELPVTRLPSVQLIINGVQIPALLDTGSPITVINAQAAEKAGIETVDIPGKGSYKKDGFPLANFANTFTVSQAAAQAAARGDILTIAGTNGERVDIIKSKAKAEIGLAAEDNRRTDISQEQQVNFGNSNIYVGNLPGLAALNALGDDSPPAAVLGMDVLRLRPKMLFRAKHHEIYL